MDERDENGWDQYQRLVLSELQRLSAGIDILTDQMAKVHVQIAVLQRLSAGIDILTDQMAKVHAQIAVLKLKAGGWSILGGSITVIAFILIQYLSKR